MDTGEQEILRSGGFEYQVLEDGTAGICNGEPDNWQIVIPTILGGRRVTRVMPYAFAGRDDFDTVIFADGVTRICEDAFFMCRMLEKLELPRTLQVIEESAFYSCEELKSIKFPDSLKEFIDAFSSCNKLEEVLVSPGNPSFCSVDGVIFSRDLRSLVFYPAGRRGSSYEVPAGTGTICSFAFNGAAGLRALSVPDGVTAIGECAFALCRELRDVRLPDSVKEIGNEAFSTCESLEEITLPASLEKIENYLFSCCHALRHLAVPEKVTEIGEKAFEDCFNLRSITIPAGTAGIGKDAFLNCEALEAIRVSPGNPAFSVRGGVLFSMDGKRLLCFPAALEESEYTVPEGTECIEDSAFTKAKNLVSVRFPDSLARIHANAFDSCLKLREIRLPDSLTMLSAAAFRRCTSLESVRIPEKVGHIGDMAFAGCDKLSSVIVEGPETTLGNAVFEWSQGVVVTVPKDSAALQWCTESGVPFRT